MTYRHETNQGTMAFMGIAAAGLLASVLSLSGCGSEPPPPPVVRAPPPPPPPPAPPKPKTVQELMAELNIDPRVDLPEGRAPASTADRRAVLEFFDGVARGDSESLKTMLSEPDRDALSAMVAIGAWKAATERIQKVRVQTGGNPQDAGELCALAIIEDGETYQPQLWSFLSKPDGTASFRAIATPPGIMNRLAGDDWILAWFKVLEEEMLLAQKPDEDLNAPKVVSEKDEDEAESGGSGPGLSTGGGGGGKRKVGRKIRAPGRQ